MNARIWLGIRSLFRRIVTIMRFAGTKGVWALTDQAIASLGTFLVGLFLARHLESSDYGAFALVLGILFFLNAVHNGMVTYPLTIKGAGSSEQELGILTGANIVWTGLLSVPLAVVMSLAVSVVGDPRHIPFAVLALFAWQFHETARRGMMTHLRYRELIPGDALKFGGWAATTFFLVLVGAASLGTVLFALAVLSFLAGVIQCFQVRAQFSRTLPISEIRREAWRLGKLVLAGSVLSFFSIQFFSWALLVLRDIDESARMQAMVLILGLMHPVMFSISNILVPAVSGAEQRDSHYRAIRVGLSYGVMGGAIVLPYFLLVATMPGAFLTLFFGTGSPYLDLTTELRIFTLTYTLIYGSYVFSGMLNGLRRVPAGFVSQLLGAALAIIVGVPLIAYWGLLGAVVAGAVSFGMQVVIALAYLMFPARLPWANALLLERDAQLLSNAR